MKTILFSICIFITTGAVAQHVQQPASVHKDTSMQEPPVYRSYQGIKYFQGNAMFINNSMGTNPPPNTNIAPFNSNGDYIDPSKNMIPPNPQRTNANTNRAHQ